jgi:hypothetical protein
MDEFVDAERVDLRMSVSTNTMKRGGKDIRAIISSVSGHVTGLNHNEFNDEEVGTP